MIILGIETSCDETAASVVEVKNNKIRVLSNVISSQVKLHAKFGGVVPNLAAREHVKNIEHVFRLALKQASKSGKLPVDLIAVTRGPGLGPALLVGITFARTLAWKYNKPLIGVNHLEGHIYSNWLSPIANTKSKILNPKQIFPILNLIVSGGHTELVLMKDYGKYELIGETLDDAVGEAFDKVARLLGLGYPGGPAVAQRATEFKVTSLKLQVPEFEFPRPMQYSKDYNFSYSGLKTAVLYKIRELESSGIKITNPIRDKVCYEFQKAACDVLIKKTVRAAKEHGVKSIFLSGGVSANKHLRLELGKAAQELGLKYSQPELEYTGDNAVMIALAGYFSKLKVGSEKLKIKTDPALVAKSGTSWKSVEMDTNLGF